MKVTLVYLHIGYTPAVPKYYTLFPKNTQTAKPKPIYLIRTLNAHHLIPKNDILKLKIIHTIYFI